MQTCERQHFVERAYDDWAWEVYDEWYPFLWSEAKGPLAPVQAIIHSFDDIQKKPNHEIRILDAACGTGNLYVLLSLAGFDVWATDGFGKMLERAMHNCKHAQSKGHEVSERQLIMEPVAWSNCDAYQRHFSKRGLLFDFIVVCTNSFCHLPSTSNDPSAPEQRYMQEALVNFRNLLKPNGRLLIDTKRYVLGAADQLEGAPTFRELKYDSHENGWVERQVRLEEREIKGRSVWCHTRLHYDIDPCFKVCRALVVATIYGKDSGGDSQRNLLPYYPLPAEILEREMKNARFEPIILRSREQPVGDWSYDFVIGQKGETS